MARIIQIMASERVIAPAKIGEKRLGGKINADAVVKPLLVGRAVGVNDKIRLVANLHVETFAQEIEEEIRGLRESRPEIAKIDAHSLFHSRSVNGLKKGCQGRASLIPILPSREEIKIKSKIRIRSRKCTQASLSFILEDDFPFPLGGGFGSTKFFDLFQVKPCRAVLRADLQRVAESLLGPGEIALHKLLQRPGKAFP